MRGQTGILVEADANVGAGAVVVQAQTSQKVLRAPAALTENRPDVIWCHAKAERQCSYERLEIKNDFRHGSRCDDDYWGMSQDERAALR